MRQKIASKPFTVVGDGSQLRDFLYVTDVARAFLCAAETDKIGQTYNIGAGQPNSINRLVELLGGDKIHIPKRPGEPDCTFGDITKAKAELAWEPKVSFEEGVALILNDLNYWRAAPLWDPSSIAGATRTWFKFMGNENING